ncbi:thioredoxin C-1 [Clostridium tepidiprofundi DSM 19306]|uniref:Thioredoxin n=1 Tax=Clostridium tepidiprofundi DSM 19306 TaxID=1121338 RepID=A0A151B5R9_9CLOT|nr:thioredoxin [Clostridium tepidiprofundi]KYH35236.1 thioredoxin C-1 [Clostridium tepidiprofundi DSM 19306]
MLHVNQGSFVKEVLESDKPVVVDFWAEWCGPCKMLSPVIEEAEKEIAPKAKFVKINVDDNPALAQQFGIASIPTVMVFDKGNVKDTMIGFRPKNDIVNFVERNL